jgi:hypothetical protein
MADRLGACFFESARYSRLVRSLREFWEDIPARALRRVYVVFEQLDFAERSAPVINTQWWQNQRQLVLSRGFLAFVLAIFAILAPAQIAGAQSDTHCAAGEAPNFSGGFAALKARVGDGMGTAISCEFPDPNGTGDVQQRTTTGLAYWRKSTNTPTFTNGSNHWAETPNGFVTWAGASADPPQAFPDVLVSAYLTACEKAASSDTDSLAAYCQCTIDKFQSTYSLPDFINVAQRLTVGDFPPEAKTIIFDCAVQFLT